MKTNTLVRVMNPSEAERQLILHELSELVANPHFVSSKRYPALLEYVVTKTLRGEADELKERTIGIEVFHRPSDYDTNNDTVVRVAAGEVRRRLTVSYRENGPEHQVQIALPSGSYVPEFYRVETSEVLVVVTEQPPSSTQELQAAAPTALPLVSFGRVLRKWLWLFTPIFALTVVILLWRTKANTPAFFSSDPVMRFWQPLQSAPGGVIISPGTMVTSTTNAYGMKIARDKDEYAYTSVATTVAVSDLVSLFSRRQVAYSVEPTSSLTLDEMRVNPVVLIGAYNNDWTARLQEELRYQFAPSPGREIVDRQNPTKIWTRPANLPLNQEDDYFVVARFYSKLTGNLVVLLAGIGKNGTEAAAEFVTSPRYLQLVEDQTKNSAKNVEAVLRIKVVDGKNSAPTMEAVSSW